MCQSQDPWRATIPLLIVTTWTTLAPAQSKMDVVDEISVETYRHYLDDQLFARDGDVRTPFAPQHDMARDNIEAAFRSFGLETTLEPFQWQSNTFYNVVGVKRGSVYPDRQYIIGAHYDSVNVPGADDNASSVAGVMEIARVLSQYEFESTLVFIGFDIEEPGLVGSARYVEQHAGDDIRGMVSMDLIAYNSGTTTCVIYGRAASNPIKSALGEAVARYSNLAAEIRGQLDRSDHAPFEARGIQACWLIEQDGLERNPCYHRLCDSVDTPGYIDYDYAVQIVRGLTGYLVEHAGLIDPSRCDDIKKFDASCRQHGVVKALVRYRNRDHNGESVTFLLDNGRDFRMNVDGKRARLLTCCLEGEHTVALIDPADCRPPVVVDCRE